MLVNRYFYREISQSVFAVLAVLILIFASKHFVRFLSDAASGDLPTSMILQVLSLFTLSSLVVMVPFALFVAILISMGRLYKDNEITAMEACGIGLPQITASIMRYAVVFAFFVAFLSLWVAPWSEQKQHEIRIQATAEKEFSFLAPGQFHEIQQGKGVFYMERMSDDKRHMESVFVHLEQDGRRDIFSAKRGLQEFDQFGNRYIVLQDGYRFEILADGQGYRSHHYRVTGIRLDQAAGKALTLPYRAMSSFGLWGSDQINQIAELQWRLSMPVSILLLTPIAVLLSRTNPRQGRFAKLFGALIVFIVYFYLLMLSRSWLKAGVVPPLLGMWWVHGLALLFVLMLMRQQFANRHKTRPLKPA
ncbi:MAG: LPS export ABC transporter permease LptF [Gammaproteobacteria bacterium]|nr:LPS export ABC transporter permease LptF [Gammaproteobacteria bacterium]MDH5729000.1 LPS export ABC transporter permease LptF [Gammaproteobacteria bacterium]